jgi:hypothetical protein
LAQKKKKKRRRRQAPSGAVRRRQAPSGAVRRRQAPSGAVRRRPEGIPPSLLFIFIKAAWVYFLLILDT